MRHFAFVLLLLAGTALSVLVTVLSGVAFSQQLRYDWIDTDPRPLDFWEADLDGAPVGNIQPAEVTPMPAVGATPAFRRAIVNAVATPGQFRSLRACRVLGGCSDRSNAQTVGAQNTATMTTTPSSTITPTMTVTPSFTTVVTSTPTPSLTITPSIPPTRSPSPTPSSTPTSRPSPPILIGVQIVSSVPVTVIVTQPTPTP